MMQRNNVSSARGTGVTETHRMRDVSRHKSMDVLQADVRGSLRGRDPRAQPVPAKPASPLSCRRARTPIDRVDAIATPFEKEQPEQTKLAWRRMNTGLKPHCHLLCAVGSPGSAESHSRPPNGFPDQAGRVRTSLRSVGEGGPPYLFPGPKTKGTCS